MEKLQVEGGDQEKEKNNNKNNQQYKEDMGKIVGKSQVRRGDVKGNMQSCIFFIMKRKLLWNQPDTNKELHEGSISDNTGKNTFLMLPDAGP